MSCGPRDPYPQQEAGGGLNNDGPEGNTSP